MNGFPSLKATHWRRLGFVFLWTAVLIGRLDAAVSGSMIDRLRAAVELPKVEFGGQLGASAVEEWHSDHDVPDVRLVLRELRSGLKGQPSEAPILIRIARLERRVSREAFNTSCDVALESARRWLESDPNSADPRLSLADVLWLKGNEEESLKILTPLIGAESKHARALSCRGIQLIELAMRGWVRSAETVGFLGAPSGEEGFQKCEATIREATALLDRAVASAPEDPWPLIWRARVKSMESTVAANRKPPTSRTERERLTISLMYPAASLPDLRAALKLRPDDPRLLAGIIAHECATAFGATWDTKGDSGGITGLLRRLPEDQQERVRADLGRLERLGEHSDPRRAAMALENLALLRMLMRASAMDVGPEATRAMRLDPRRSQSFGLHVVGILSAEPPDLGRLESVLRERVATYPEERFLLALAKAQMLRGNLSGAIETVLGALNTYPESVPLRMAEFGLRLKAGAFPKGVDPGAILAGVATGLERMPEGGERAILHRQFFITLVLANALEGELKVARERLRQFLSQVPDDDYALAVDKLLKELPPEE
jgi:tetratricopeptide (TPR) repeat protein